ncbi:hypothetical protein PFISCL1PPCAC_8676, partial [Pristionchus fissidentatus]
INCDYQVGDSRLGTGISFSPLNYLHYLPNFAFSLANLHCLSTVPYSTSEEICSTRAFPSAYFSLESFVSFPD